MGHEPATDKADQDSDITSHSNKWACDTMNKPRYPLGLFLKIITASMQTPEILEAIPVPDIRNPNS